MSALCAGALSWWRIYFSIGMPGLFFCSACIRSRLRTWKTWNRIPRFIHLKTNLPALKRRTFIRNVKCFNYSSFVNKNSKENVFYLRIVVGIHRLVLRHGMAQQHTPSVHKHDKHVLPSGPVDPGLLWGWGWISLPHRGLLLRLWVVKPEPRLVCSYNSVEESVSVPLILP